MSLMWNSRKTTLQVKEIDSCYLLGRYSILVPVWKLYGLHFFSTLFCAVEISISGSWHYTDPGPSGYMLDVFEEGNPERYIGQFADPHPQSSAKACSGGKVTKSAPDLGKFAQEKFNFLIVSHSAFF